MEIERVIVIAETERGDMWSVFVYYAESANNGFFDNRFNGGFIRNFSVFASKTRSIDSFRSV